MGARSHARLAPQSARRLPGSVIIVDSDPSTAWLLAGGLRRAGFPVVIAGTGETAMEMITNAHVDLMVTNLRLPDVRGDVLFYLSVGVRPHLRGGTLFTTDDNSERARDLVAMTGCELLLKPFRLDDFVSAVLSLDRRRDA